MGVRRTRGRTPRPRSPPLSSRLFYRDSGLLLLLQERFDQIVTIIEIKVALLARQRHVGCQVDNFNKSSYVYGYGVQAVSVS